MNIKKLPTLKVCPFCSSAAMIYQDDATTLLHAGCANTHNDCRVIAMTNGYEDADVAADAWNRRGRIILAS